MPSPNSNLPCEIVSSVAAVFASNAGLLSGAIKIAVASFIFLVFEAIIVSMLKGSYQLESEGRGKLPNGYL